MAGCSACAVESMFGGMSGQFYGGGNYLQGAAPVYRTPMMGGAGATSSYNSLGMTGALGGISATPQSYGYSGYGAQQCAPQQYGSQNYGQQYGVQQYASQQYGASQYGAAAYQYGAGSTSVAGGSAYGASSCPPPPQMSACCPPPIIVQAPPQYRCIEAPPCCPQPCEQPPVILQLPAPTPPCCPPLPPPPSVIHIKDDSGPKLASLQAEIRRLERLLAAGKEIEAALRAEIAELQGRLELAAQKEAQLAACDAEVQKLREQLLEAQRRLVFLEQQRDEAHKHIAFLENQLKAADNQIAQMAARIKQLEGEIANLRQRLEMKSEMHSRTNVTETYKVPTFELAWKLAESDGTNDGLFNGLPIEVEGEGLFIDMWKSGRRPRENVSLTGRPQSQTTTTETYKVQTFELAEKLAKMGPGDGKFNGLPIEVIGEGMYIDLVRAGRRANPSVGGGQVTGGQTYKVANMEMAAKISKMGPSDDGTYKGMPIEVQGMGLYRDLRRA